MAPGRALRRFLEPIFDAQQLLTFGASVIGLVIILHSASAPERKMQVEQWTIATEAFGIALVAWALISLASSPFLVARDDRARGRWDGHHFIYHTPQLITARRFQANDAVADIHEFRFDDVEPNAFVEFRVEASPPAKGRITAIVSPSLPPNIKSSFPWGPENSCTNGSIIGQRVNRKRTSYLMVRLEPATVPVVVRIYCHGYFVGKTDTEYVPLIAA